MRNTSSLVHLLLLHGDKAIALAAFTWFAVVSVGFFQTPEALEPGMQNDWKTVSHYMESYEPEPVEVADRSGELRASLRPDPADIAAEPWPSWVMHKPPQFLYSVDEIPEVTFAHSVSSITDVDGSERGQITVSWKAGETSDSLLAEHALWRQVSGGQWERLGVLHEGEDYVDGTVLPAKAYAYRVVSTARLDPDYPPNEEYGVKTFPAELRRLESAASATVKTRRNMAITVNSVTPAEPISRRPGTAQLTVHVWNPKRKAFDRKMVFVREGQAIGKGRFATGATLERAWVGRRGVRKVDSVDLGRPGQPTETIDELTPAP